MKHRLRVNGELHEVDVSDDTPLLWVLRDTLGLTGTKYGCGMMVCGACTVLVDGAAQRVCSVPVSAFNDRQNIVTIEGLGADRPHALQKAWTELSVSQCGYCQPGMIMAAAAMLEKIPDPTDADIDKQITNICRCGTYQGIRAGIKLAARELNRG